MMMKKDHHPMQPISFPLLLADLYHRLTFQHPKYLFHLCNHVDRTVLSIQREN
jgi:hypothetical protein